MYVHVEVIMLLIVNLSINLLSICQNSESGRDNNYNMTVLSLTKICFEHGE